ncbi:MAG: O-antigen ligase family protein [Deltaproteobacteria bacterium]|nr:O-antigen ligase family protein [Deltaproteobacteria bacterium]
MSTNKLDLLGQAGLLLLAAGCFRPVANGNYAMIMLLIWFILSLRNLWPRLKHDPLFYLSLGFTAYLLVSLALSPPDSLRSFQEIRRACESMLKAGFFGTLLVAMAQSRQPRKPCLLAGLMLFSLCSQVSADPRFWQAGNWFEAWHGDRLWRFKLGYSANSLGAWCNLTILALLTVLNPWRQPTSSRRRKTAGLIFWAAGLVMALSLLFLTHSRSAWGALFPALLLLPAAKWSKLPSGRRWSCLGVGCGLLIVAAHLPPVKKNFLLEKDSFKKLARGHRHEIKTESLGDRLAMLGFFLEEWPRRPFFGLGPGSTPGLLQAAAPRFSSISGYRHLHNGYLQILLEVGIGGLLFYCGLAFLLLRGLRRQPQKDDDWLLSSLTMLIFFALHNHPIGSHQGPFAIALLTGLAYRPTMGSAEPKSELKIPAALKRPESGGQQVAAELHGQTAQLTQKG